MAYSWWKRGLDVAGAAVLLALASPLCAATILALWLTDGLSVLYRQQRVGKGGRPFQLYKFRTMTPGNAPISPDRPVSKNPDDPRVTPFGSWLRRYALDELPQLVNILRGEMSLVGPRPLPVEDLHRPGWLSGLSEEEHARRLAWLQARHQVLPGLTGHWQISPNPEEDFENWIACDLAYVREISLLTDLRILLLTPAAILRGRKTTTGDLPVVEVEGAGR